MSVLLVSDDVDDDTSTQTITHQEEHFYKQLKELEFDSALSDTSLTPIESSSSILGQSDRHSRQHRRRRRSRSPQCSVQHVLTYMLALLFLTNQFHWSAILLSFSSLKFMSAHASTTAGSSSFDLTSQRPPATASPFNEGEQQCLPVDGTRIDRLCSKTCGGQRTPFGRASNEAASAPLTDTHYLPFCSHYLLDRSLGKANFLNESSEDECRTTLQQMITLDDEARRAFQLFASYMKAIDSASDENRYSIIKSDCLQAYRTWTCSVQIPFFYRNQLIPPCQTICDEVERVCPTFRPSDREPLFAGQPLFFCNGGIVTNSDYARRPHCFDTCHLAGGSLQRHSVSSSSNESFQPPSSSLAIALENLVTTPRCFDIEPLPAPPPPPSAIFLTESSDYPNTSNTSISVSAKIVAPSFLTLSVVLLTSLSLPRFDS